MISHYINAKKTIYIAIGLYLAVFYTVLLAIQKDGQVQTNCNVNCFFLALM